MKLFNNNDIIDLSSDMVYSYTNDLSPEENLITTYIQNKYGSTKVLHQSLRDECKKMINRGVYSLGLGKFATLKDGTNDT